MVLSKHGKAGAILCVLYRPDNVSLHAVAYLQGSSNARSDTNIGSIVGRVSARRIALGIELGPCIGDVPSSAICAQRPISQAYCRRPKVGLCSWYTGAGVAGLRCR